jgi:hypothetical protein
MLVAALVMAWFLRLMALNSWHAADHDQGLPLPERYGRRARQPSPWIGGYDDITGGLATAWLCILGITLWL